MSATRKLNVERQMNVENLDAGHFDLFQRNKSGKSIHIPVDGYWDAALMQVSIFNGIELMMSAIEETKLTTNQSTDLSNTITTLCRLGKSLTMQTEAEGLDSVLNG